MYNSEIPTTRLNQACVSDPMKRFFASHQNEISIGREAIAAAIGETKGLMDRLGIASMYGCQAVGPEPEYSGDIDRTEREMSGLIDAARELRGLCETLAQRL